MFKFILLTLLIWMFNVEHFKALLYKNSFKRLNGSVWYNEKHHPLVRNPVRAQSPHSGNIIFVNEFRRLGLLKRNNGKSFQRGIANFEYSTKNPIFQLFQKPIIRQIATQIDKILSKKQKAKRSSRMPKKLTIEIVNKLQEKTKIPPITGYDIKKQIKIELIAKTPTKKPSTTEDDYTEFEVIRTQKITKGADATTPKGEKKIVSIHTTDNDDDNSDDSDDDDDDDDDDEDDDDDDSDDDYKEGGENTSASALPPEMSTEMSTLPEIELSEEVKEIVPTTEIQTVETVETEDVSSEPTISEEDMTLPENLENTDEEIVQTPPTVSNVPTVEVSSIASKRSTLSTTRSKKPKTTEKSKTTQSTTATAKTKATKSTTISKYLATPVEQFSSLANVVYYIPVSYSEVAQDIPTENSDYCVEPDNWQTVGEEVYTCPTMSPPCIEVTTCFAEHQRDRKINPKKTWLKKNATVKSDTTTGSTAITIAHSGQSTMSSDNSTHNKTYHTRMTTVFTPTPIENFPSLSVDVFYLPKHWSLPPQDPECEQEEESVEETVYAPETNAWEESTEVDNYASFIATTIAIETTEATCKTTSCTTTTQCTTKCTTKCTTECPKSTTCPTETTTQECDDSKSTNSVKSNKRTPTQEIE